MAVDGWMVLLQRRLVGEKGTGPSPTDGAKSGTKRSIVVDGKGVPIGVTVDAANRHDMMKMTKATTLQSIVVHRPEPPTITLKQHMYVWMDKGYDFPEVYELLKDYGYYTIHIRLRGRKDNKRKRIPTYRSRRCGGWLREHILG
jgi:putative transposase